MRTTSAGGPQCGSNNWTMWTQNKLECIERKPKHLKDLIKKFQNPFFFYLGQELVTPAHLKAQWSNFLEDLNWKLNEAFSWKIWIESKQIKTNQNKEKSMMFFIVLHLKPKTLLYLVELFIYINLKCPNSWLKNIKFDWK